MSINKIKLSPAMLADLYAESLVTEKSKSEAEPVKIQHHEPIGQTAGNWKWVGSNQKNIVILFNNETVDYPEKEIIFLKEILGACKLSMEDVAILNYLMNEDVTYKKLTDFFHSRIVILFDVSPDTFGLPMNFPHYQIQAFAKNSFLYAPSLTSLLDNKEEKRKLWTSLKRLFNL